MQAEFPLPKQAEDAKNEAFSRIREMAAASHFLSQLRRSLQRKAFRHGNDNLLTGKGRVDGLTGAAEVRGFNLRTRTSGYKDYPLHAEDFVALAVCVAVLAAAIVLAVVG